MNIAIARPISWTSNCSLWTFSVYIPQLKLWSSGIHLTIYFPVNIFSMNLPWFLFYQQHSWDADLRNFLLSLLCYNVNTQSNYLANNRAEDSSLWGSCVLSCFVRPVHRSHIASSAAYRRNCCSFRVLLSWRWSQSDTGWSLRCLLAQKLLQDAYHRSLDVSDMSSYCPEVLHMLHMCSQVSMTFWMFPDANDGETTAQLFHMPVYVTFSEWYTVCVNLVHTVHKFWTLQCTCIRWSHTLISSWCVIHVHV